MTIVRHLHRLAGVAIAVGAMFVATQAASAAPVTPDIVGGTPSTSAPSFLGSLQLSQNGDANWHTCVVTLINPSFAETNAHCVTNEPTGVAASATAHRLYGNWLSTVSPNVDRTDPSIYHIRFGSLDRLSGGVTRTISQITVNPAWAWGTPNAKGEIGDIALLRLSKPVTTLKPAVIFPVASTQKAREIGWGITDEAGSAGWTGPAPRYLNQIDVDVNPVSDCDGAGIGVGELCISGKGGGTCNGDSGSPALQQQGTGPAWSAAVGSDSRVEFDTCGDVGEPDVYTDLWYYVDWMISSIYA